MAGSVGIVAGPVGDDVQRGTPVDPCGHAPLDDLADWTLWAEQIITF
jgi:hypothetical protein